MIHLYMKQDYVSIKNRIIVTDETGNDVYLIIGKWGRVGDGLSLYAMDGTLLVEVKQTFLSIFPKFDLYLSGNKVASITKYYHFKGPYFKVSHLKWTIKGDFNHHHYWVQQGMKTIMEMEKTYSASSDFYSLSIDQQKNAPICSCIAVIVDHLTLTRMPTKSKRQKNHSIQFT